MNITADGNNPAARPQSEAPRASPPINLTAEMSLLGALMANNAAYGRVRDFLAAEHFADPLHARIYAAISHRIETGQPADAVAVREDFRVAGELAEIGGGSYLVQLLTAMAGIANVGEHGRAVHGAWVGRAILWELLSSEEPEILAPDASEQRLIADIAADQARRVVAGDQGYEQTPEEQADGLLERISRGLDEAHARADRLLARMSRATWRSRSI